MQDEPDKPPPDQPGGSGPPEGPPPPAADPSEATSPGAPPPSSDQAPPAEPGLPPAQPAADQAPAAGAPPAAGPPLGEPGPADREGSKGPTVAVAAVLALAIGAVGGFLVARSQAQGQVGGNATAAEQRGFERGQQATEQRFAPGRPEYKRIFDTGVASGFRNGRRVGITSGQRQANREGPEDATQLSLQQGQASRPSGQSAGVAAGARAALGGFGSWEAGTFYIVRVQAGTQEGVSYRITGRRPLNATARYALCAEETSQLCAEPVPGGE